MQAFVNMFFILTLSIVAAENPLSKVIDLLDALGAKITKDGEAEANAYKACMEWCDCTSKNQTFEIQAATMRKAKLEALIGKATEDASASASKIEELIASIATDEASLESANKMRGAEAADFSSSEAELVGCIDTLVRALAVLEREMAKNTAAFTQMDASGVVNGLTAIVDAASFSNADKQKLLSLVQAHSGMDEDDGELQAPEAAVYTTHSTSILDVLEDLKEKAEQELSALRKAEINAKHNFALLKQSLEDRIAADTKDLTNEKVAQAAAVEAKATAEKELTMCTKELADAEAALEVVKDSCAQATADHAATLKSRNEELAAITEAKKVLEECTSGAVKQAYAMLQVQESETISRSHTRANLASAKVISLVKRLAQEHHSLVLQQLVSRIVATLKMGAAGGDDPFAKVKALIEECISKLEAQAGSEATEKAYCDEQMAKTEEKKSNLDSDISKLTAKIDLAVARSAGLKGEVSELQVELAALAEMQVEMDRVRQQSHAAFVEAKADLEKGLEGVRHAVTVLREYYGRAATSMLQADAGMSDIMQLPAAPGYTKAEGAGHSIIQILEVVEYDFAKNLATEEAAEDNAVADYEKTTQTNQVTKAIKDQDVLYKTQEFKSTDRSISALSADHETMSAELSAVLEYYAKIKERCIAKPETYEARKARREAEIAGLKQALACLEDEAALVQHRARSRMASFLRMPGQ